MIYIVHNHLTNNQETLSEQQLENYYSELKEGQLEIIDEIDDQPFIISYDQAQSLNQCLASLHELVAFKDDLSKDELTQNLATLLTQIDITLTPTHP